MLIGQGCDAFFDGDAATFGRLENSDGRDSDHGAIRIEIEQGGHAKFLISNGDTCHFGDLRCRFRARRHPIFRRAYRSDLDRVVASRHRFVRIKNINRERIVADESLIGLIDDRGTFGLIFIASETWIILREVRKSSSAIDGDLAMPRRFNRGDRCKDG